MCYTHSLSCGKCGHVFHRLPARCTSWVLRGLVNCLNRTPIPLSSDLSSEWPKGIDSLTSRPPTWDAAALPSPGRHSQCVHRHRGEVSAFGTPNITAGTPRDVPLRKHYHLLSTGTLFRSSEILHAVPGEGGFPAILQAFVVGGCSLCSPKLIPVLRSVWLFDTQVSSPDFSETPSRAGRQSRRPKLGVSWDHSSLTAGQQKLLASGAHSRWGCT